MIKPTARSRNHDGNALAIQLQRLDRAFRSGDWNVKERFARKQKFID